jgi:hypothetical protein
MSKPDENDGPASDDPVKPDSTPRLFGKWTLPDNCRVISAEQFNAKFVALVGPPMRRIEPTKD